MFAPERRPRAPPAPHPQPRERPVLPPERRFHSRIRLGPPARTLLASSGPCLLLQVRPVWEAAARPPRARPPPPVAVSPRASSAPRAKGKPEKVSRQTGLRNWSTRETERGQKPREVLGTGWGCGRRSSCCTSVPSSLTVTGSRSFGHRPLRWAHPEDSAPPLPRGHSGARPERTVAARGSAHEGTPGVPLNPSHTAKILSSALKCSSGRGGA